mgnify:CR=1 FL=1
MIRWLLFAVLLVAALCSFGLDAASLPQASQMVDLVTERAITPALEAQWSRGSGAKAPREESRL